MVVGRAALTRAAAACVLVVHSIGLALADDRPPSFRKGTERLVAARALDPAVVPDDPGATLRQWEVLSRFEDARVAYRSDGVPSLITGRSPIWLNETSIDAAIPMLRALFLGQGTEELRVVGREQGVTGSHRVSFEQWIRGIQVVGAGVVLMTGPGSHQVSIISALFVPDRNLGTKPEIAPQRARELAIEAVRGVGDTPDIMVEVGEPVLVYTVVPNRDDFNLLAVHLAWLVPLTHEVANTLRVEIDAVTGEALRFHSAAVSALSPGRVEDAHD